MRKILIAMAMLALSAGVAQAADVANGKTVFTRCAMCHNAAKGAGNKIGPNLFGVVGRKSASIAGFNYSSAMKGFGKIWTPQLLDVYLTHPGATVPGTKMSFGGLSNTKQRADVIAYLQTLK